MLNAMNLMPNDRNTAGPEQTGTLGTERVVSTIPVADPKALPGHQQAEAADGTPTWSYPSEQMFYNAMKRKVSLFTPSLPAGQQSCGQWFAAAIPI